MKKLLFSLMILLAIFTLAGSGSFAFLTDTETSTDNTFTAGWVPPSVTVIYANGGEVWYIYQTVAIRWTVVDPVGIFLHTPLTINIWFDAHSGTTGYPYHIATNLTQTTLGPGVYNWYIPYDSYLISHNCRIRVTAVDAMGTILSDISDADFCPDELIADEDSAAVIDLNLTLQDTAAGDNGTPAGDSE